MRKIKYLLAASTALLALLTTSNALAAWNKCQLHAHSNRSWDATHFPEAVAAIYYGFGYKCLVLSEHNTFTGEYWIAGTNQERTNYDSVLPGRRETSDAGLTRVPSFHESKAFIEAQFPGFFLIPGIELTVGQPINVHLNVFGGVDANMTAIDGGTAAQSVTSNVAAARALNIRVIQVNHPNFRWGLEVSDYAQADVDVMEVWNTHIYGRNDGDDTHAATDIQWDTANALRVSLGMPLIYGSATDDAHYYFDNLTLTFPLNLPNNGWIMVWSDTETPTEFELVENIKAGRFYASTGVTLNTVQNEHGCMTVESSNSEDLIEAYAISPAGMTFVVASSKGALTYCPDRCFAFGRMRVTSADGSKAWTQPVMSY